MKISHGEVELIDTKINKKASLKNKEAFTIEINKNH
jgi:hypothetical protein